MKMSTLVAAVILSLAASAHAQDVMKVAPEHYKVLYEDAHVRVIENTLGPGEKDAMHTHPSGWYYVTKPGTMKVTYADGKVDTWEAKAGEQAWLKAEPPHTSENMGKAPMGFILVEVKSAPATPEAVKKEEAKAAKKPKK
jgi:quercetin dioxygenase-like cupin family protein